MSHCCEDHEQSSPDEQIVEENQVMQDAATPVVTSNNNTIVWGIVFLVVVSLIFNNYYSIQITRRNGVLASKNSPSQTAAKNTVDSVALASVVTPQDGVIIPVEWGTLGQQMIDTGVIDEKKFKDLFSNELTPDQEALLAGRLNTPFILKQDNSRFLLDVLWAFGLANKNDILENGEMADERYGGPERFASTAGWTLSKGNPMDHFSAHAFVTLTDSQQKMVDEVSRNIYRPCCGNSTHFPDCNHGIAMLGLLELMAVQGKTEEEMYDIALKVNSYWFPQVYMDLAQHFAEQGTQWDEVDAKTVLGQQYSSVQGYTSVKNKITSVPNQQQGGGGCGA